MVLLPKFPWKSNFQRVKKRGDLLRLSGRSGRTDKVDLPGPPGLSASAKITATQPGLPGPWERSDGLLGHPRTCLGVPAARPGRRTVRCWVPEASVPAAALPPRSGAAGRGGAGPCLRLLNPEPELRSVSLCRVSRDCPYHFRLPEGRRVPRPAELCFQDQPSRQDFQFRL